MNEIGIQVKNKIASLVDKYAYAVDYNSDYTIHFVFDDEWNVPEHFAKTARFWYNDQFVDVPFDGNVVQAPILVDAGKVLVGAYSGNLHTTTPCTLYVKKAILDYGGKQIDPQQSVYDKIMEMIGERSVRGYYTSIKYVCPYLYDIWYESIDYQYAYEYFQNAQSAPITGSCTSFRKGNFFGRNYDWLYDNTTEFRVYVPRSGDRFASVGVAGGLKTLTNDFVASGEYENSYRILPFYLLDGINEHGVTASMNVVPLDKGENVSVPFATKFEDVCGTMLVRFIIDNFKTATEAVEYIRDHVSVYFPTSLHKMHYEIHYMVADSTKTYLLEFIDTMAVITDMTPGSESHLDGRSYMTNFYLSDVTLNQNGTVYTPYDVEHGGYLPTEINHITENGSGLERFNLISNMLPYVSDAMTKEMMRSFMTSLYYTNSYKWPITVADIPWYTEFVGINELTCDSLPEEFAPVVETAHQYYVDRERGDGKTWHTVHSSVYDFANKKLYIIVQESGIEYETNLDSVLRNGKSAYEVAVQNGFSGTQAEWLESLIGNGIESIQYNDDYTITIICTDGTSYTTGNIRGATGNGIESAELNDDYTLTLNFTDGESFTTDRSIRGEKGDVNYATFELDPETGHISMVYDEAYSGPSFRITEDGHMEVIIHG